MSERLWQRTFSKVNTKGDASGSFEPGLVPAITSRVALSRGRRTIFKCQRAWARLIARVYEIDPLVCPECGSEMKVIAVIQDPVEIRDILAHLVKTGRAPAGFDPTLMN